MLINYMNGSICLVITLLLQEERKDPSLVNHKK
jgi:uncharacterized membrane protein YdcZ (DUF606 family)